MNQVDEEHGLLSFEEIVSVCREVFRDYQVDFCILFGSYAKGTARQDSDIDLLIATEITGLKFYGIIERLRESLRKKVDLLDMKQIVNNEKLLFEILKTGIRIYG
ncbi:MAG: nucleotidyltransferase domain-containing protein, partial [Erysipelotrichaceae bacterium]|nr:nucleotidyltransferase domain-containing protein [Erysipelotrichaceae bacterium]